MKSKAKWSKEAKRATPGIDRALSLVAAERRHQVDKGWTPEHDDETHDDGSNALAAACYAAPKGSGLLGIRRDGTLGDPFPWSDRRYGTTRNASRGKSRKQCLVIAAALIVSEIERLTRAERRRAR